MRVLSAADLLDVWEQGCTAHPLVRPLLMLAASFPETSPAHLAQEPLGTLNARLWELRAALVGTAVVGCVECPRCGERVEVEFDAADLATPVSPSPSGPVRALTLTDLLAAAGEADPAALLVGRCLPNGPGDDATAPGPLAEVSAALAAADPAAEVLLRLVCPACGHDWPAPLDVGSFLWSELDRLVEDTVRDVDLLARCYSWSERDVLHLSPVRRRRYVELATDGW